jgi:hypothetical protein
MPYTVRFTPSGAEVRYAGVLTYADVAGAMETMAGHPYARGRRYVLADETAVTAFALTEPEVRALAARRALYDAPGLVIAVVAPRPEAHERARTWETFAAEGGAAPPMHLASTRASAVAWLTASGVPAEELAP